MEPDSLSSHNFRVIRRGVSRFRVLGKPWKRSSKEAFMQDMTGVAIRRFFLASRKGCVVCTDHLPRVNTKTTKKNSTLHRTGLSIMKTPTKSQFILLTKPDLPVTGCFERNGRLGTSLQVNSFTSLAKGTKNIHAKCVSCSRENYFTAWIRIETTILRPTLSRCLFEIMTWNLCPFLKWNRSLVICCNKSICIPLRELSMSK